MGRSASRATRGAAPEAATLARLIHDAETDARPRWNYLLAHVEHERLTLTPGPGSEGKRDGWRDLCGADAADVLARWEAWHASWELLWTRCGWIDRHDGDAEKEAATLALSVEVGAEGDALALWLECDTAELVALALRLEAVPERRAA